MSTIEEATQQLSEFLEGHLLNACSKSPQNFSRIIWITGEDSARNQVLNKLMPRSHSGDSCVLDDVAGIGHIRRLVWFEQLDMTALPKSTNFYIAAIVRLEEALRRRNVHPRREARKLSNAKMSLSLGFPDNVRERAGALDPDSYTVEVQRASMAQVMGPEHVAEAFEESAQTLHESLRIDPLFVFPITNLEFGHERLKEFLPATKVLRSPRLIFVLTSDGSIVEAARFALDVERYIPRAQIISVTA